MSRETRPIPGLFGGISQQIPAMRHPTQCEEQRNFLATVVDGLFTRPGTQHLGFLDLTGANGASVQGSNGEAFAHYIPRPNGDLYIAVLVNGNLMVYNALTGVAQTVTFPNGKTYLNNSAPSAGFSCLTLADYTFVVNTSMVPALSATVVAANDPKVVYVDVRTSVANVGYQVTIDAATQTYSTGVSPTHGEIASNLVTQLGTALGGGYTVTQVPGTNVIKVVKASGTITVSTYDSWDNQGLRIISNGVPTYTDLPPKFDMGYVVTISGTAENNKDAYYVKWDGSKWVETAKPGTHTTLNHATMPHQLSQSTGGAWVFEQIPDWGQRLTGDEDTTSPDPSFVGTTIRDVFFYRNRLGFLTSTASAVLSRAGEYFDFFPRTAVQVLDNDPIDLTAPVDGITYFAWAVPFNQNLLIWTDTKQQLVMTGGDVLSPKTARLIPASTFTADPAARPGALGNRAVFAEKAGDYAALSSYRVAQDTVTNMAVPITDHVPRLIPSAPRHLVSSTSSRMVIAIPSEASEELAAFKYELDEEGEKYTQRAWSRVVFETGTAMRVITGTWQGHRLFLLCHYTSPSDPVAGGRFASEVIDFQRDVVDTNLDHALCMDRRLLLTGGVYNSGTNRTTYTVPFLDPAVAIMRCAMGTEPYPLTPLSSTISTWGTVIALAGDTTAQAIWAGIRYTAVYEFTEAVFRDTNGVPVQSAVVKLLHYIIRYVRSSRALALVTPYLRDTYTYDFAGRILGLPGNGAGQLSLSTGDFRIPVDAKAAGTRVRIETNAPVAVVLPYAEWVADVTMTAHR